MYFKPSDEILANEIMYLCLHKIMRNNLVFQLPNLILKSAEIVS